MIPSFFQLFIPPLVSLYLFFFLLGGGVNAQFAASRNFWPAAYPLAVRSPYLNCWENTPGGTQSLNIWPEHWNAQSIMGWSGFVRVDGVPFQWLGESGNATVLRQSTVTPTRSIFEVVAGNVLLNVTFLSPIEPNDLVKQSFPFMYLSVDVSSLDGPAHNVQIYSDVSAEWVSGDRTNVAVWSTSNNGVSIYHSFQRQDRQPLMETKEIAEDSIGYYAMSASSSMTFQSGQDIVVRGQFQTQGRLTNTQDSNFRPINQNFVVFGLATDLGTITSTSSPIVWALGLVRDPVVEYQEGPSGPTSRSAYFWSAFDNISDAINAFLLDFPNALTRAEALDSQIMNAAASVSSDYVDIVSLGTRQAMAGVDITISKNLDGSWNTTDVLSFVKDVGNSGRVNPVDTLFATMPIFLYLNASMLGYILKPLLQYQNSSLYTFNFAAPDLGTQYPQALGDNTPDSNEGIANSANMLIMALAHAQFSGDGSVAGQYYYLLKEWADYLVANSLAPGTQSEDGVAKVNQTNLAIKGIIGIQAMAVIAKAAGQAADVASYSANASSFARQWTQLATSSGHILSTYSPASSDALIYNLYADKLLGLNLVDSSVYTAQTTFYDSLSSSIFGLPFEGNTTVVRSDYTLLTAATVTDSNVRSKLISMVRSRATNNQTLGAFPSTYDGTSGQSTTGQASPSQGGLFSVLTLNLNRKNFTVIPTSNATSSSLVGTNAKKPKGGVIAGAVMAIVVGIGFLVSLAFFWRRRRRLKYGHQKPFPFDPEYFARPTPQRPPPSLPVIAPSSSSPPNVPAQLVIPNAQQYGSNGYSPDSTYPRNYTSPSNYPSAYPSSLQPQYAAPAAPVSQRREKGGYVSEQTQDAWESQTQASSFILPSDVTYPSTLSTRSRTRTSETTNQLRGEIENLRREMSHLRAQREHELAPPPMYE